MNENGVSSGNKSKHIIIITIHIVNIVNASIDGPSSTVLT